MMQIKITQINTRYAVEIIGQNQRFHMLSERALIWNLKRVFGIKPEEIIVIRALLEDQGFISLDLEEAA